jgi:O-methyltransferase involved in polyketide biosynthesis
MRHEMEEDLDVPAAVLDLVATWPEPVMDDGEALGGRIPLGPTKPSAARIYDYFLGGRDHYDVDRAVGDQVLARAPWARTGALACRRYLQETVADMATRGLDQVLDIGCGLPFAPNVHEIVQAVDRRSLVVYVDNDPVVLAFARALLAHADSRVTVLDYDVRTPDLILKHVAETGVLDLKRPVGVLLSAVLHFVPDDGRPGEIVATLRDGLAPGSRIMISHTFAEDDWQGQRTVVAAQGYSLDATTFVPRRRGEIAALFEGLAMQAPGLTQLTYDGEPVTVLGGVGVVGPDRMESPRFPGANGSPLVAWNGADQ